MAPHFAPRPPSQQPGRLPGPVSCCAVRSASTCRPNQALVPSPFSPQPGRGCSDSAPHCSPTRPSPLPPGDSRGVRRFLGAGELGQEAVASCPSSALGGLWLSGLTPAGVWAVPSESDSCRALVKSAMGRVPALWHLCWSCHLGRHRRARGGTNEVGAIGLSCFSFQTPSWGPSRLCPLATCRILETRWARTAGRSGPF